MKRVKEEFKKKSEEFIDNTEDKKQNKIITITRQLIQEDDFILSLEEIERMEKNAKLRIDNANNEIIIANERLDECKKLRELL